MRQQKSHHLTSRAGRAQHEGGTDTCAGERGRGHQQPGGQHDDRAVHRAPRGPTWQTTPRAGPRAAAALRVRRSAAVVWEPRRRKGKEWIVRCMDSRSEWKCRLQKVQERRLRLCNALSLRWRKPRGRGHLLGDLEERLKSHVCTYISGACSIYVM